MKHPERVLRSCEKWLSEHPEYEKKRARRRYKENPRYVLAKTKEWGKKNPVKLRVIDQNNRARRAKALILGGGVTVDEWLTILEKYSYSCSYCGVSGVKLEMDHIVPIARGGVHSPGNIVPACRSCNSSKGASTLDEWKARKEGCGDVCNFQ